MMVFIPQIPQSGAKQKRDGQPAPCLWTVAELTQQSTKRKVKVLRPNKFVFEGSMYEDGLVMEHIHFSYLCVLENSPQNITPFMQSHNLVSSSFLPMSQILHAGFDSSR